MIETDKRNGIFTVTCDTCGNYEEFETEDWQEFIDQAKLVGWVIRKDGEDWTHYCKKVCYHNR